MALEHAPTPGGRKPCSAPCRSTHRTACNASSVYSRPHRLWLSRARPPNSASGTRPRMAAATQVNGNERQGVVSL
eukprot:1554346-Lingulodinium_polyedra.AAC.1